ncbi:MAG: ABC transporter ATP-binding protein [Planctomycetes bacterium]|nr:ABC transporter ATP-binding protein [Planctomycetota bacterium]
MIFRLERVTKLYDGIKALDDITIEVRPGAIGLLGPNGAGKSTLIKCLLGLVQITAGRVSVLDLDARRDSRRIRQQVGYMPEDDCTIAGLGGVQAVAYMGQLSGLPARTALRRAHEMLDYVGIADERYREVQTYSTGMKQKMKFAQALIHAPKVLFLDEPTTGLDPQGRDRMLRLIRNLPEKKGLSVIISTHILQDVEACCDSVIILGRGRLLVYDTLRRLRRSVNETYTVRYTGDRAAFMKALVDSGCAAQPAGEDEITVVREGDATPSAVFKSALISGAVVRQISPSRTSLEDIFLKALRG